MPISLILKKWDMGINFIINLLQTNFLYEAINIYFKLIKLFVGSKNVVYLRLKLQINWKEVMHLI
jgi:hypothetical protein